MELIGRSGRLLILDAPRVIVGLVGVLGIPKGWWVPGVLQVCLPDDGV